MVSTTNINKPCPDQMAFPSQTTLTPTTTLRARLTTQDGLAISNLSSLVSTKPPYLASPAPASFDASRGGGQEAMGATYDFYGTYGSGSSDGGYRRISSKYILPEPPATGLFLLPRPRAIVLTLARFTPWSANACRSIFHSVHLFI